MFGLRPKVIKEKLTRVGLVIWAVSLNVFFLGASTVLLMEARAYNLGWVPPIMATVGLLSTTYFVVSCWKTREAQPGSPLSPP